MDARDDPPEDQGDPIVVIPPIYTLKGVFESLSAASAYYGAMSNG